MNVSVCSCLHSREELYLKVTVKLYAVLQVGRFKEKVMTFPSGTTVQEVVETLGLPSQHVDILLVNGTHVVAEHFLKDNDILSLLPMVEGG
jgi:sulfur carrier protein ThiS